MQHRLNKKQQLMLAEVYALYTCHKMKSIKQLMRENGQEDLHKMRGDYKPNLRFIRTYFENHLPKEVM